MERSNSPSQTIAHPSSTDWSVDDSVPMATHSEATDTGTMIRKLDVPDYAFILIRCRLVGFH
jgi:hypothetical protein